MSYYNDSYAAEQWYDSMANDYYDRTEDAREEDEQEEPEFDEAEHKAKLIQRVLEIHDEADQYREHLNVADLVAESEEVENEQV